MPDGRDCYRHPVLALHELDQHNRPLFTVEGLKNCTGPFEGPCAQTYWLAGPDTALSSYLVQALFHMVNDGIPDSGRLVRKAHHPHDPSGRTKLCPAWVGRCNVDKDVTRKKRLKLLSAFATPDFFDGDLGVKAGNVLILQMQNGAFTLAGFVLK